MNIIAFVAHPDDEVNCAGLLHKNFLEGGRNFVICFTGNKKRAAEFKKSCDIIGARGVVLGIPEFEIKQAQKLHKNLIETIRDFKPDIAVLQANDYHPDHKAVFQISLNALEFASHGKNGWLTKKILELETSAMITYPDIILDVTEEHSIKFRALEAHKTQVEGKSFGNYYFDYIEHKGRLRGSMIGAKYGEAYKLHTQTIKGNFYPHFCGCNKACDIIK
ncbi:hypothetical protein D6745_00040 [Candidatus Woesearchaeota archaeon]|nr:MAG: hypothetical protein D6745_00040 [Candidatus Woesearchaeota archaeon]